MPSIYYTTPWCTLKITQHNDRLCEIDFVSDSKIPHNIQKNTQDRVLIEVLKQIEAYRQSSAYVFELPLKLQGTDFQCRVWAALQAIPAGEVRTYGEVARVLQSSPRAVGNACRKNPVPLVVPCHRVVSAQGIGGFDGHREGGKVSIKQQLLSHEGVEF